MADSLRERYALLTAACDRVLKAPGADPSVLAIKWLHLTSGHPTTLSEYDDVLLGRSSTAWRYRWVGRLMLRMREMVRNREAKAFEFDSSPRQVLLVGVLVDSRHLEQDSDFYFGNIQRMLAGREISSYLLLQNQTGASTEELRAMARRRGMMARDLLPDRLDRANERAVWAGATRARRNLTKPMADETAFERNVREATRDRAVSSATLANLRLERTIEMISRAAKPRMIITMYEGHAWERSAWRGARRGAPRAQCAGYQHTIIRESSHALRRLLGGDADPDLLLCVGDITREELRATPGLAGVRSMVLGTHRRPSDAADAEAPVRRPACLVLPEGLPDEARLMFAFALDAARRIPGIRFIYRSHPILPPEELISEALSGGPAPENLELSRNRSFEEDLMRCGSLLYRGSSTALYGILAGLKPFYVAREGELGIEPLYRLTHWKEMVRTPADFVEALSADMQSSDEYRAMQWAVAKDFASRYTMPEQETTLDALAELIQREES